MGKLKPRIKGKGKKWPKGQSASSNPTITKFRDVAKNRFFTPNLGTSRALTIGALKTHNAIVTQPISSAPRSSTENETEWSDASSVATSTTFKTFASDWSNCSNASFGRLLNNFQPSSALHKEMLAVLAAVTEVIKGQGGVESSTEYFAALMTALDVSESEESTAAIVSLLGMGIKSVPEEVLRLKFAEASKILMDKLTQYSEDDNFVIIRCIIGCLSVLLRAQDHSVWTFSSTTQIFQSILVFTIYSKPKVRKAAQHAVLAILKGSSLISEESNHPAATPTAKFCIQKIESSATLGGGTVTLHVLALLKEVLSTFPRAHIKTSCETILKLLTLGNVLMTSCCLQALHGLFMSQPPATRLTPTLNAQLIHALYDYQPSANDWQTVLSWLTVMESAFCNLARVDPALCGDNMVKLFTVITQLWLCDNTKLMANATCTLRTVTLECLSKCKSCQNYTDVSRNIFSIVENGLKFQYHNAWPQVLHLLAALFEVFGSDAVSFTSQCLKTLGELRDTYNFSHVAELEYTVGKAIRTLGPEAVLTVIPLNITGKETNYEFKRAWLLPVLKENIQTSTLGFFSRYFLPLASLCRKRSEELANAKDSVGSHSYELICCQIWALLPSFCNNPSDVSESFKHIAPVLGTVLRDWKTLRLSIMSALRKVIQKCQEKKNEADLKVLGRYAKNYLPIMFNIYTTKPKGSDEEGQRLATYDTIKVYLSVADSALCGQLFDTAFAHFGDEKIDQFMNESVLDIVRALLVYLDESRIEKVYDHCISSLRKKAQSHEEKKLYRLLEDLCSCPSEPCRNFLHTKIDEIKEILLSSLGNKKVGHAGARLRCLRRLVQWIPGEQVDVFKDIVPETVIRCKDPNAKTRACAFDLLSEMLAIMKEKSQKAPEDVSREYFHMLLGGLLGNPSLVSATILGLSKLIYTLGEHVPGDVIEVLLENINTLLGTKTREVAAACLAFIKTFIVAFPQSYVLPHLPTITSGITSMVEDCKRHSRLKIRDILDRLLRKFGYETMKDLIPAEDAIMQKRLKNLKKINARKKKGKESEGGEDEDYISEMDQFSIKSRPKSIDEILASSDDEEEAEPPPIEKRRDKRKAQMYIKEDDEDIVDLIAPNLACKLSATKPTAQPSTSAGVKKDPAAAFKVAPDGRLIIPRDLVDDTKKQKSSKKIDGDDDNDEEVNEVASAISSVKIGKKRPRSVASASVMSEPPAKYQAGGKGIHRPIKTSKAKKANNNEDPGLKTGKEYRATKARGDMKIKGKPDPYAYIPLSRKFLNKRKKAKASGRFKNIIKSAVKGAKAGSKKKNIRK